MPCCKRSVERTFYRSVWEVYPEGDAAGAVGVCPRTHADMLLLDEPVSAVDRKGIEVFYDLVTSLRSEYHMPVILVSHDLSHVARYATRAALLDRTIRVSGDVKKVMASPEVRETFGLDVVGGVHA